MKLGVVIVSETYLHVHITCIYTHALNINIVKLHVERHTEMGGTVKHRGHAET